MKLKISLIALLALGTVGLAAQPASALPNGLPLVRNQVPNLEQVGWVCNVWGRCWWRPNYYRSYGFYAGPPRFGYRPWGWRHGGWRRW